MPQQQNIVINDGATTPVAHTFAPNGALMGPDKKITSEWVDRSPPFVVGYHTIREQQAPSNINGLLKIRWVIERVSTETLSGATSPTKAYSNTVVIESWVHDRASSAETADMVAFAKNFTASAYFASKVTSRERTW